MVAIFDALWSIGHSPDLSVPKLPVDFAGVNLDNV